MLNTDWLSGCDHVLRINIAFVLAAACTGEKTAFKDGASFCYCAYVLRISRYSGFLRNLPPNTAIFLRGL